MEHGNQVAFYTEFPADLIPLAACEDCRQRTRHKPAESNLNPGVSVK